VRARDDLRFVHSPLGLRLVCSLVAMHAGEFARPDRIVRHEPRVVVVDLHVDGPVRSFRVV
jgi:hypothetical protein